MEVINSVMDLKKIFPRPGRVQWLGIRPAKGEEMEQGSEVWLDAELGLIGDHYSGRSGKRHVTLIQAEHLDAIASMMGLASLEPRLTRRNVVVRGLNLLALKDLRFRLGEAELEMTGQCYPCSKMERNLGAGGYNAMRGHGGITARVISGGKVELGDTLEPLLEKS